MSAPKLLVLGTRNRKKAIELVELFAPLGIEVVTLEHFPQAVDVVEGGDSFAANARLKARTQAIHLGQWVLGEDSGLVVDALDGAPGIYSARYAGERATDEENNRRLLAELNEIPPARRAAHYVCHMALSDPDGQIVADTEEACHGRVREFPAGHNGFGYDPLFEIIELHRTFGELGPAVKRALSHRSRAARAMRRILAQQPEASTC